MKPTALVLSCEHAVNHVPAPYAHLFKHQSEVLKTHRAFDCGALEIANHLSKGLACDLSISAITRLLIDCNRSIAHPQFFSEFSKSLPESEKTKLVEEYYLPYRRHTEAMIKQHITQGHQVLHLSIHSFTPQINGVTRNAAIGLLYDPARHGEQEVARIWHGLLIAQPPAYKVRKNYPYRGKTDGFTSALRKCYPEEDYLGLEVECNQALMEEKKSFAELTHSLLSSLKDLLQLL